MGLLVLSEWQCHSYRKWQLGMELISTDSPADLVTRNELTLHIATMYVWEHASINSLSHSLGVCVTLENYMCMPVL